MFDEATALRLERLERETSRRKWDSAVMTASQRVRIKQASSGSLVDSPCAEPEPEDSGTPLLGLFVERLERLERKDERLEWQLSRLERRHLLWKRSVYAALATFALFGLGYGAVSAMPKASGGTAAGSRAFALPSQEHVAKTAPEATAGRAWIRP